MELKKGKRKQAEIKFAPPSSASPMNLDCSMRGTETFILFNTHFTKNK